MHSLFLTEKSVPLEGMAPTTMCSVIDTIASTGFLYTQDRQFSHREMAVPILPIIAIHRTDKEYCHPAVFRKP